MTSVRWGLVSTARINRKIIPAIRASERGELVAVASRRQESADFYAAEWDIPLAFSSYKAMLDSDAVDAVYISLPNHLHAEWTIYALTHGKNVLCEKPFAPTLAEVDRMIAAAGETGKVLAEAFMYRHHPQMKRVGEMVQNGLLGEITVVRGVFNFKAQDRATNIRLNPDKGGGCLWDVGVYPLSFAQYVMGGPPLSVFGQQWIGDTGVDEVFSGQMHYPGGRMAQITASFRTPYYTFTEVIGVEGRLSLTQPFVPGRGAGSRHLIFTAPDGSEQEVEVPEKEVYLCEIEDMNAAILDGAPTYLSLEETRNHVRTVLALYESARTGRMVTL